MTPIQIWAAIIATEFEAARERSSGFVEYGAAIDIALIDLLDRIVMALQEALIEGTEK
jgi:hypothetical protein